MTDYDAERFAPGSGQKEGRVGMLWAEIETMGGFITLYDRNPERDPETHWAILKDIQYLCIGPVNALALLKFLKRWEPEIVKRIAEDAVEAAGRR